MRLSWLIASCAAVALSTPATAQDAVGSSIVDGRPVQLLSDNTWRYTSTAPTECQAIKSSVSFCGKRSGWTQFPPASSDIAANYRLNDRSYGLLIIEDIGISEGITLDFMRSAAIEHAAKSSAVQEKDVNVISPETGEIDGRPAETFSYLVKIDNIPVVFTNSIVLDEHRTVQVVTYGLGTSLTEEMTANHKRFLAETRLK